MILVVFVSHPTFAHNLQTSVVFGPPLVSEGCQQAQTPSCVAQEPNHPYALKYFLLQALLHKLRSHDSVDSDEVVQNILALLA